MANTTTIQQSGINFTVDNRVSQYQGWGKKYSNNANKGDVYPADPSSMAFGINAVEIDWNGAKPGMTEGPNGITTTGELLGIIKDYVDQSASNNSGSNTVASSDTLGLIKIGYAANGNNRAVLLDSNNKAYVDTSHNHDLKIETTTNSTSITLAHDTAYKLTAGGKEYNFKTPADYVHPTKSTTQFTAPDGKYIKKITLDSTGHIDNVTYATMPTPEIYANDLSISETNDFDSPTPITSLTLAPGESKIVYVKTFPYYAGEKSTTEGKVVFGTPSNEDYITVERFPNQEVIQGQNMVNSNNVFEITAKDTITSTISNLKARFRLKYSYGISKEVAITVQPAAEPQLTLSSTSGSIIRPKGSLNLISANGGSDNITVTVGSTANITAPTSLTLTYAANTNKTASTPTATYNGASVTPTWSSSDTSVATVSGTTITAKAAGSATLTATYNGKTATYNLTVTNESISGSVTSGWTYTSASTSIATISGTTVTGVAQGTTHIKVNYSGNTCDLTGTVTVNVAPQANYWYAGYEEQSSVDTNNIKTLPTEIGWHNFTTGTTSLHVGELSNDTKVNWFVLVPADSGLVNVCDAGEILSGYTNSTITIGTTSYTKIMQDDASKKFDYDITN